MKKKDKKELKQKLIVAVKKVLESNNGILTAKIEKAVKNSIKLIVKKSRKKITTKKKAAVAK